MATFYSLYTLLLASPSPAGNETPIIRYIVLVMLREQVSRAYPTKIRYEAEVVARESLCIWWHH